MKDANNRWVWFFVLAAGFNFCTGGAIFFHPGWSYSIAYIGLPDDSTLRFWSDFGFAVLLVGLGYLIIALDLDRGQGIAVLGVIAKLFDVIVLPTRWIEGLAHGIVIVPAAIDGLFCIGFILYLIRRRSASY
jgi:hypothetical protein